MRRACKVDSNHAEVRDALRSIGVAVYDASAAGRGMSDLICAWRGLVYLVEVKDGKQRPSARELTGDQVVFHALMASQGVKVHVVTSTDEALAIFGATAA